jgi:hypothetical protein
MYSVSLRCSVYCLCVNVYCTAVLCVLFVCKCVLYCCIVYCLCVNVYLLLPPGVKPTAVKYTNINNISISVVMSILFKYFCLFCVVSCISRLLSTVICILCYAVSVMGHFLWTQHGNKQEFNLLLRNN